jgi:hypothetical protein
MPDTPEKELTKIAKQAEADVIVCGHTHLPFVRAAHGVLFINTVTVGRCPDGMAQYARCEVAEGVRAETVAVPYDMDRLLAAVAASALPDAFLEYFRSGRDLEEIE